MPLLKKNKGLPNSTPLKEERGPQTPVKEVEATSGEIEGTVSKTGKSQKGTFLRKFSIRKSKIGANVASQLGRTFNQAVDILDEKLPGESTRDILAKACQTSMIKAPLKDPKLSTAIKIEVAKVFGLQDVTLSHSPFKSSKKKLPHSFVCLSAPYIKNYLHLVGPDNTGGLSTDQLSELGEETIAFPNIRKLHEWITNGSTPSDKVYIEISEVVENVTGIPVTVTRIESSKLAKDIFTHGPTNSTKLVPREKCIVLHETEKLTVHSECVFQIEGLTQDTQQLLSDFAAEVLTRRWIPYHGVLVDTQEKTGTFLRLLNYPEGETALLVHTQGLVALSLEHTEGFTCITQLFRSIIWPNVKHQQDSLLPPDDTQIQSTFFNLHTLHDTHTQSTFLQVKNEILASDWGNYCLRELLKVTENLYLKNHKSGKIFRSASPISEILSEARENCSDLYISLTPPKGALQRIQQILQKVALSVACAKEICRNNTAATLKVTHDGAYLRTGVILRVNPYFLKQILKEQFSKEERHFSMQEEGTEYHVCIDLASSGLINSLEKVTEAVTQVSLMCNNIEIICCGLSEVLHTNGELKTSSLECSYQKNFRDLSREHPFPVLSISWERYFRERREKPKLREKVEEKGLKCSDTHLILDLKVCSSTSEETLALANFIKEKVSITVEKIPGPRKETGKRKSLFKKAKNHDTEKEGGNDSSPEGEEDTPEKEKKSTWKTFCGYFKRKPKEKKQPFFTTVKMLFVALAAAIIISATIYISLSYSPKLKDLPNAVQGVGSAVVGILISGIGYACAKKIPSTKTHSITPEAPPMVVSEITH